MAIAKMMKKPKKKQAKPPRSAGSMRSYAAQRRMTPGY